MQKFKVNGQSVRKIVETNGQMHGGDCITSHNNAVTNHVFLCENDHNQNVNTAIVQLVQTAMGIHIILETEGGLKFYFFILHRVSCIFRMDTFNESTSSEALNEGKR